MTVCARVCAQWCMEQWFEAIYRTAILAPHMCQSLVLKWPLIKNQQSEEAIKINHLKGDIMLFQVCALR